MDLLKVIEAWLVFINIFTFAAYALDKYKAVHHAWRIPETEPTVEFRTDKKRNRRNR